MKRFFDLLDRPLSDLAGSLGIPSSYILGLSAYQIGYYNDHNVGLNDPCRLTAGGGNNLSFDSITSPVSFWNVQYGSQVQGATSPSDFTQRLEGVLDGQPMSGWHTYNTVNSQWGSDVASTINSISRREQNWQQSK